MFTWHDTTRRRLCRLAFLALAAGPTCAVLMAAAWVRSPQLTQAHERALAERLALDVTLAKVSFPRPAVTRYERLLIVDPESRQPLAQIATVEIDRSANATVIRCDEPILSGWRMEIFWELAGRRLREQSKERQPIEFAAHRLTLRFDPKPPTTLYEVSGRFESAETQARSAWKCKMTDDSAAPELRLALDRPRPTVGSTPRIDLHTGDNALAAHLMSALVPSWQRWAGEGSFAGELAWQERAEGVDAQIRGTIGNLDLDRLVTERFHRKLSGAATLVLDEARIDRGRLSEARGVLAASAGLADLELLVDVAYQLHSQIALQQMTRGAQMPYDQLAFAFALDNRGLTLEGKCPSAPPGTMLTTTEGALVREPATKEPQPVLNLVRALAGSAELRVPASWAAQNLIGWLPAPAENQEPARISQQPRVLENTLRR